MSISNTTENNILGLYFTATAIANIADNAATSPETNVAYALHSSTPGDAGTQGTNEIAYTGYARVDVARSGTGHTVSAGSVSPDASVDFPAGTGGSGTATNFSTGKSSVTGTGADIYWSGSISPSIVCGSGVTPQLTTATACTLD